MRFLLSNNILYYIIVAYYTSVVVSYGTYAHVVFVGKGSSAAFCEPTPEGLSELKDY